MDNTSTNRAFIAISIQDTLRLQIAEYCASLISSIPGNSHRWVKPENYHITLKFLGNISEPFQNRLLQSVSLAIKRYKPFVIQLGELSFFPDLLAPKICILTVEPSNEIAELACEIEQASIMLGLPAEQRDYQPHLTLARLTQQIVPDPKQHPFPGALINVTQAHLFHSRSGSHGVNYHAVETMPLGTEYEP